MFMASSASAAIITKTFDFTAHSFGASNGVAAPVNPVIGSFTVTFDDAIDAGAKTTGITVNSLNIGVASAVGYTFFSETNSLVIGGIRASILGVSSGFDDFWLSIDNASHADHQYNNFMYTQAGTQGFWQTTAFGDLPSAVPEPATWAMMITGFGLAGTAIRRRRQTLIAA